MQSKLKETFIINLIIIVMLCVIGGYSQKESVAVLSDFDDKPIYKNKKCTIRKGALYVKPTTRGRKKQG